MKKFHHYIAAGLAFLCMPAVYAQDAAPTPPPAMIQIFREDVKPGKGPLHAKSEASFVRAMKNGHADTSYTALVSITGEGQAWFITRYDSYDAWGKDTKAQMSNAALSAEIDRINTSDGDLLSGARSMMARYRADLSYRPGVSIPLTRYFSISIVRVRPGHVAEFEEARKIIKAAHEKAALKFNYSVYQVSSGWAAGTFLIITPYRTLAELDAAGPLHGKAYDDALGDDGRKKLNELAGSANIGTDLMLFVVDPRMSYPSKETIAADPAFWNPKPAAMPPAAKKPADAKKQ